MLNWILRIYLMLFALGSAFWATGLALMGDVFTTDAMWSHDSRKEALGWFITAVVAASASIYIYNLPEV